MFNIFLYWEFFQETFDSPMYQPDSIYYQSPTIKLKIEEFFVLENSSVTQEKHI